MKILARSKFLPMSMATALVSILLFLFVTLNLKSYVPDSTTSDEISPNGDQWQRAAKEIDSWISNHELSGVVLVTSRDKIRFQRSYGMSDYSKNLRPTDSTRFNIGSLAKQFTGFIFLTLETEGKVDLSRLGRDYLPELGGTQVGSIRLADLMQHSSGLPVLPHLTKYIQVQAGSKVWSTDEFLQEIKTYHTEFEPGSQAKYSNVAYRILAAIIEKIESKSFHDVIRERIIKPFGLDHTYLQQSDEIPEGLAQSYGHIKPFIFFGSTRLLPLPNWNYSMIIGAGGLVSTARDLYRWDRTLAKLSAENPELMRKYFAGGGLYGTGYSYGWGITPANSRIGLPAYQSHTGGTPGFFSVMIRVPDRDACVVMLFNTFWSAFDDEPEFYDRLIKIVGE